LSRRERIARWLPVLVWAVVISSFSTQWFTGERTGGFLVPLLAALFPWASTGQLEIMHQGIRRLAHFAEYLVLSLLLYRALRHDVHWDRRAALQAIVLSGLYAMLDELHQSFVPGRTAAATDCLINLTGAASGQGLLAAWHTGISLRRLP
jgi:VanZ family protein